MAKILIFITLIFLSYFPATLAQIYDWVPIHDDDIRVVINPKVEAELRIHLIRQAKTSIDLITFDQRFDVHVGMAVLHALEEAAQRGVHVRFALSWLMTPVMDPLGRVKSYLQGIAKRNPNFEFSFVSGPPMWFQSWRTMDGAHEKLLVVDGKWAMTTGRGHADQYLEWLDTGFFFKGGLVIQTSEAFHELWKTILKENPSHGMNTNDPPNVTHILGCPDKVWKENLSTEPISSGKISSQTTLSLDSKEKLELESLIEWTRRPPLGGGVYRARVLHHNLLEQLRSQNLKPKKYRYNQRLEQIEDPVVKIVIDQLKTARSLKFTTLTPILHPKLKDALQAKLKEPFHLEIFTNSKKAHQTLLALRPTAGWYMGLPDLDDVLRYKGTEGYLLVPGKQGGPRYLHRKLIIIEQDPHHPDGLQSSVIFGSHNLTYASSVVTDEVSFQIEGEEFAGKMSQLFQESLDAYGKLIHKPTLHYQRTHSPWRQRISQKLKWAY